MADVKHQSIWMLIPIAVLSLSWGTYSLLQLLYDTIRLGPFKVFGTRKWKQRPTVLDDPSLGTHHFAQLKNIRLHYVAKGPEDRPLVLMVHGFTELWYAWRNQIRALGTDYRVVAFDLRGHGESDKPKDYREYHMSTLVEDIKNFITYLGYKKCYLVAHDGGGIICWMFAACYPELVDKLVILNAPHPFMYTRYISKHPLQAIITQWYAFLFQIPYLSEIVFRANDWTVLNKFYTDAVRRHPERFTEKDMDAYKYSLRNLSDIRGVTNYYRSFFRLAPMRLTNTKVKSPTMVVWGTQDIALNREFPELTRKYIDNQYTINYIESTGHLVQLEEPEMVNKYILGFLA